MDILIRSNQISDSKSLAFLQLAKNTSKFKLGPLESKYDQNCAHWHHECYNVKTVSIDRFIISVDHIWLTFCKGVKIITLYFSLLNVPIHVISLLHVVKC